jgi:predicted small secreted protein
MKALMLSAALCLMLAGCNTMAGLGQDMQQAGANLQQRATESQQASVEDNGQLYNPMSPPDYQPPPPPQPYPSME